MKSFRKHIAMLTIHSFNFETLDVPVLCLTRIQLKHDFKNVELSNNLTVRIVIAKYSNVLVISREIGMVPL